LEKNFFYQYLLDKIGSAAINNWKRWSFTIN